MALSRRGRYPGVGDPPYALHDEAESAYPSSRHQRNLPTPRQQPQEIVVVHPRSRAISRIDDFEDRLAAQEKTTESLIDRAYRVKEDIVQNLQLTQSSWQQEKERRELLQEHIRAITDVVNRLNSDINRLQGELQQRDTVVGGTRDNVKTLEMHHVAGVTDLRGRVARCDGAIAKLSADLKTSNETIKAINSQQNEHNSKILEKLSSIENRMTDLYSRVERTQSDSTIQIKHLESDTEQQMQGLDGRTRTLLGDVKNQLTLVQATAATERERLEARVTGYSDKAYGSLNSRQDKLESHLDEYGRDMQQRLTQLEDVYLKEVHQLGASVQKLERDLTQSVESHSRKNSEEVTRFKRECREGFGAVHESITNMKQVVEGKRKLMEEQLRKEVSQIRKMVVLV